MNAGKQAELFEALAELSRRYPEWRFGQLVANLAGWADQDVWDAEDERLLEAAKCHLDAAVNGTSQTSNSATASGRS